MSMELSPTQCNVQLCFFLCVCVVVCMSRFEVLQSCSLNFDKIKSDIAFIIFLACSYTIEKKIFVITFVMLTL